MPQPPDRQRLKEVFALALEQPEDGRERFLDSVCDDPALRREVETLLAAHGDPHPIIERNDFAASSLIGAPGAGYEGRLFGHYRVLSELGRGGMGTVYLAERSDGEFEQRVALKVVRRSFADSDLRRRFRRERQILASLNHPNIARLFDGGVSEDGEPYLVMEYVEGSRIDDYCEERGLSVEGRLRLFLTVCGAVQHAHQNLIVHCDLKPTNIMVTRGGEVKLLDFGVAKLLNPEPAGAGLTQTQTQQLALTPEYASPEQVRGGRVTTATDVYSLGVILYELLTGERPSQPKDTSPEKLSREHDSAPSKPSEVALTRPPDGTRGARSRPTTRHPKLPRGDLDSIVLMAISKDPARRYRSAEQLAEDIKRHLNGRPVVARPATYRYHAAKFVRRNRVGVAAAGLVFLSLVFGLVATAWQARAARRAQARAEETKSFLERMLNYSNPILTGNGRETTVADVLDEAAARLEGGEFSQQPEVRAELEYSIGHAYLAQGKSHLAERHILEYVSLQRQLYGERDPKRLVAMSKLAQLFFFRGAFPESESTFRQVLPLMRAEQERGNVKAASLADALNNFAYLRRTQGDSAEAESLFREALALGPQLSPDEWRGIDGTTRSTLASTLADQGKFEEAFETSREAAAESRRRGEVDTPNLGFALTVYGGFLSDREDFAEADANLSAAEAIFRKSLSPSALWLGDNLRNQSVSFYRQGRYAEALSRATEALNIYRESFGTHYDHYPTALAIRGLSLTRLGQSKEGERDVREAVRLRAETLPAGHYWVALADSALGECLTIQGRYGEAEPLLVESYNNLRAGQGEQNPRTSETRRRLAQLYEAWGRPDAARQYQTTHIVN